MDRYNRRLRQRCGAVVSVPDPGGWTGGDSGAVTAQCKAGVGGSAVSQFLRIARGETLGLCELEYVQVTVVNSASHRAALLRNILPSEINPLLIKATVSISVTIIGATVLSFLGLVVLPPAPS